jgi:uncharacterized protein (DUF433 family)
MELPDFLTLGPKGEIRLTGHRIDLYLLVRKFNDGNPADLLHCEYPTLPLTVIHEVIAFYLGNRADINQYVAAVTSKADKLRADHQAGSGILRIRKIIEERAHTTEKV